MTSPPSPFCFCLGRRIPTKDGKTEEEELSSQECCRKRGNDSMNLLFFERRNCLFFPLCTSFPCFSFVQSVSSPSSDLGVTSAAAAAAAAAARKAVRLCRYGNFKPLPFSSLSLCENASPSLSNLPPLPKRRRHRPRRSSRKSRGKEKYVLPAVA